MTGLKIKLPSKIERALGRGAALAISISGGKDSQALLNLLVAAHRANRWPGKVFAIHADTGRTEWPQTLSHCDKITRAVGVDLVIVRRQKGDLLDRWRERMVQLAGTGKPFWSSSKNRYCTSDLKRDPIDRYLRLFRHIISAEGVRAEESHNRAKLACSQRRTRIITGSRAAMTWRPIHRLTIDQVWEACGTSSADLERRREMYRLGLHAEAMNGWPCHPAYVMGNQRLSCRLCILASRNDLINGIRHNPDHFNDLADLEEQSGCTFRADTSLVQLGIQAGVHRREAVPA